MKTGYARCSTNESKQDIERQVRELKQAGAERVFLEYEHGDAVIKEQLSLLLEQAQAGDTIITLEVSRLARSTKKSGVGFGGHMNNAARGLTAMCTLGLSNLVWKKSTGTAKEVVKNQKICLCQNCGNSWTIK